MAAEVGDVFPVDSDLAVADHGVEVGVVGVDSRCCAIPEWTEMDRWVRIVLHERFEDNKGKRNNHEKRK
jgi:hypothetical protein